MKFALKEVLERIQWDPGLKDEISHIKISYIHRGAPMDTIEIYFKDILRIEGNFIVLKSHILDDSAMDVDYIPFHRVKKIWNEDTGHIYYIKARKKIPD